MFTGATTFTRRAALAALMLAGSGCSDRVILKTPEVVQGSSQQIHLTPSEVRIALSAENLQAVYALMGATPPANLLSLTDCSLPEVLTSIGLDPRGGGNTLPADRLYILALAFARVIATSNVSDISPADRVQMRTLRPHQQEFLIRSMAADIASHWSSALRGSPSDARGTLVGSLFVDPQAFAACINRRGRDVAAAVRVFVHGLATHVTAASHLPLPVTTAPATNVAARNTPPGATTPVTLLPSALAVGSHVDVEIETTGLNLFPAARAVERVTVAFTNMDGTPAPGVSLEHVSGGSGLSLIGEGENRHLALRVVVNRQTPLSNLLAVIDIPRQAGFPALHLVGRFSVTPAPVVETGDEGDGGVQNRPVHPGSRPINTIRPGPRVII